LVTYLDNGGRGREKQQKRLCVCENVKEMGKSVATTKKMKRKGERIHSWQWWVELLMVNV
jgi:hypothetical protein